MSILFENDTGALLSVEHYLNDIIQMDEAPKINSSLFNILAPYKLESISVRKKKQRKSFNQQEVNKNFTSFEHEITCVQGKYSNLLSILKSNGYLVQSTQYKNNTDALKIADIVYEKSGENSIKDALGSNFGPATIKTLQNAKFIFPENCQFFCKDVSDIDKHLSDKQFDLILLDPPWWNKYIRRKRKKCSYAYEMMYDYDFKKIPIESLLNETGMVVVWCTNSPQHLNYLIQDIFPKWNIKFIAKWYWLKVTVNGEPVCQFSKPPGKQPFEQIIIGCRNKPCMNAPPNGKLLVSVPSAIHSHKPPLVEVLRPFLPDKPRCLELFARYLLPNWTSYGNEVLRFQHESLYTFAL